MAFPLAYTARRNLHLNSVYTLTHEAAHAEEHLIAAADYCPQIISLHMQPDFYLVLGRTCWGEYYASRRAAFSHPEMGLTLAEMFITPIDRLEMQLAEAAAAFRATLDRQTLSETVTRACTNLFVNFSRLSGHFDGLSADLPQKVISNPVFLKHPLLLTQFVNLRESLRTAQGKIGAWGSLETGLTPVIDSFMSLFSLVTS